MHSLAYLGSLLLLAFAIQALPIKHGKPLHRSAPQALQKTFQFSFTAGVPDQSSGNACTQEKSLPDYDIMGNWSPFSKSCRYESDTVKRDEQGSSEGI